MYVHSTYAQFMAGVGKSYSCFVFHFLDTPELGFIESLLKKGKHIAFSIQTYILLQPPLSPTILIYVRGPSQLFLLLFRVFFGRLPVCLPLLIHICECSTIFRGRKGREKNRAKVL